MQQIRLIHWNAAEAEERATRLRESGYDVDPTPFTPSSLRAMKEDPPQAVIIDLGRLPSQGRDVALTLRKAAATRHVPLIFVDGTPAKVARIRETLPDAVYASWDQIGDALAHAIAHPPEDPIVLDSLFDVYAGTPLPKKLGIAAGSTVALIDAPEGFEDTLGALPPGVTLTRGTDVLCDLTLWFVRARAELERDIAQVGTSIGSGGLWIIWPKQSSGVSSDLSQTAVRKVGLASGLVDFKICAVDETWCGLRFTRRKPPAG